MSPSDSAAHEIERLTRLLRDRDAEIARMHAEATGAEALITHLRLTIAKMRRELFGPRSEHKARLLDQMELLPPPRPDITMPSTRAPPPSGHPPLDADYTS